MNSTCPVCGHRSTIALPACGRCGAALSTPSAPAAVVPEPPAAASAEVAADHTVFRGALHHATTAPPVEVTSEPSPPASHPEPVLSPAPDASWPTPSSSWPDPPSPWPGPEPTASAPPLPWSAGPVVSPVRPRQAPVAVWISAGVVGLCGLFFLWPLVRYGFPLLGAFGDGSFALAFASLVLALFVLVGVWGAAFVVLAIQLVRGWPPARILTVMLASAVAVGVLVAGSPSPTGTSTHSATSFVVGLGALAVAVVLAVDPATRRWFTAHGDGAPLAVQATAALTLYLGIDAAAAGLMLFPVAVLSGRFVFFGLLLIGFGVGLFVAGRRLVQRSRGARLVITLVVLAEFGILVAVTGGDISAGAVIAAGVAVAAITALWIEPRASAFFSRRVASESGSAAPVQEERVFAGLLAGAVALGAFVWVVVPEGPSCDGYCPEPVAAQGVYTPDTQYTYEPPTEVYTPPSDVDTLPTDVSTPTPAYSSVGGETYTHSFDTVFEADGGYRTSVTLRTGDPVKFQSGMQFGSVTPGTACSIDSATSAIVPAELTVTNSTSGGFQVYPAMHLSMGYSSTVEAELYYSDDGESCQQGDFGIQWPDPLAGGGSNTSTFVFVVSDYFTPDHPDGDPTVLSENPVSFTSTSNSSDPDARSWTPGSVTGPGVSDYGAVPLNGVAGS